MFNFARLSETTKQPLCFWSEEKWLRYFLQPGLPAVGFALLKRETNGSGHGLAAHRNIACPCGDGTFSLCSECLALCFQKALSFCKLRFTFLWIYFLLSLKAICENLTTRHYKYLHKVRSALLASASNKNPTQAKPRQT